MEIFDGFISAVASELKIPFHKSKSGYYTATIEFDNGRSQDMEISLRNDESGDRVINFLSVVVSLERENMEFYRNCLRMNMEFDYGTLALRGNELVMYNSILLTGCEPRRFIKSLVYVAAKADELEEMFVKEDVN
jgi:hypothetical protein